MTEPTTLERAAGEQPVWTRLERTRMRPSRRAVMLVFLALLLYGAGANVQAGWVVMLAALAVGSVPWAWFSVRRATRSAEARRALPRRATAGVPAPTELHVRADTAALAVVHDHLTGSAGVAGRLGDGVVLTAETGLRRGELAGGEVEVRLSDPLGLVTATVKGRVPGTGLVLPPVPQLPDHADQPAWAVDPGEESRRPGHGTEVLGVREYRRGDPIKTIHWRSTARTGQVVVRELADEAQPRIRVEIADGLWSQHALDRACEAACGLADQAARAGHPVDVAADGEVQSWGPLVRALLAVLPPHAGADARPLAPAPRRDADVTVTLTQADDGVSVTVRTATGTSSVGVIPSGLDLDGLTAWLMVRSGTGVR